MNTVLQDVRYGVRMLLHKPGFTAVALLTLMLGIGANTAIFSVVNSVLLRPLPYPEPNRLVWVWDSNPSIGYPRFSSSGPNFRDWQQQSESFEQMAALTGSSFNLTGEGEPERLQGAIASPSLFPMLGVKPVIGRAFLPEEERAGAHRVALIGQNLWQRRFGGDPAILNRSLSLNGESYAVVGVVPADFRVLNQTEIWVPLSLEALQPGRGSHFLGVIARLKPDVSIEQAQAEMNDLTARLEQGYPDTNTGWGVEVESLRERIVGGIKPVLWVMLGAVGFVSTLR